MSTTNYKKAAICKMYVIAIMGSVFHGDNIAGNKSMMIHNETTDSCAQHCQNYYSQYDEDLAILLLGISETLLQFFRVLQIFTAVCIEIKFRKSCGWHMG